MFKNSENAVHPRSLSLAACIKVFPVLTSTR